MVNSLNGKRYANGVKVPAEYVTKIVQYCENTRLRSYWNPHKDVTLLILLLGMQRSWRLQDGTWALSQSCG